LIKGLSLPLNLQAHLNNYQPTRDPTNPALAFDDRFSSYVSYAMPSVAKSVFDLPPIRVAPWTIYLWGAQSSQVSLATTGGTSGPGNLELTVTFAPFKLMTDCVQNILCLGDPNFEMTNTVVVVDLTPSVEGGRLTYSQATSTVSFDPSATPGLCQNNLFAFVCSALEDVKQLFYPITQQAIGAAFETSQINSNISWALDCGARSIMNSNKPFVSATVVNGDLVIEYMTQAGDLPLSCSK
jgi:hypothetical protein